MIDLLLDALVFALAGVGLVYAALFGLVLALALGLLTLGLAMIAAGHAVDAATRGWAWARWRWRRL